MHSTAQLIDGACVNAAAVDRSELVNFDGTYVPTRGHGFIGRFSLHQKPGNDQIVIATGSSVADKATLPCRTLPLPLREGHLVSTSNLLTSSSCG